MENKNLWGTKGEVPDEEEVFPLGVANVVRKGGDVTIVTWSRIVVIAREAADMLSVRGVEAEVIDLRTIWPWDCATVLASVEKTGRLVVAHESVRAGGFGAEIAAEIGEALHGRLKSPVRRIGGPRTPIPYSHALENLARIYPAQIVEAVVAMV